MSDTQSPEESGSVDDRLASIQGEDKADIDQAIDTIHENRRERQQRKGELHHRAMVRKLLVDARDSISGEKSYDPDRLLEAAHWELRSRNGEEIEMILEGISPEGGDVEMDRGARVRFEEYMEARSRGESPLDPKDEYKALSALAKELGYFSAVTDMTPYAPITMEEVDIKGSETANDPRPVGRRRLKRETTSSPEDAAVEIPHESCDHILGVALPRSGKDSTITSIGMNLKEQHGYSYFSIFDDGRMETPMLAIPSDEQAIRENLERMGQEPRAMKTEVFVPAMPGLPDWLPANFTEFTIGIDTLTPHLILRLSGVNAKDETAEDRIQKALDDTLERSKQVNELVQRLQSYSEEMEATIEWTEIKEKDTGDGGETETYEARYEMDREKALKTAAQRLSKLAGDGLITSPDAATNIEMAEVIRDQKTASVLCCNFLPPGQESLKYTIIDLWLRLIYQARDENPRLPRVVTEIRELKNIAPSKIGDVRYKDAIKGLRQTIFFLSTQGGSRRILILGSTQKLNDVYKPVRTNMATKILLRLGEEEIDTLDRSYNFSGEEYVQLKGFDIGQGMLIAGGDHVWPIEWRGAPCGLGLGDQHWLDRYGKAWGARVRQSKFDAWPPDDADADWWVHVPTAQVCEMDVKPTIGDTYSQWYLVEDDFPEGTDRNDVDDELVEEVLEGRREYPIPSDLSLDPTSMADKDRTLVLDNHPESLDAVAKRHDVPQALRDWLERKPGTRERCLEVLRAIRDHDISSYADMGEYISFKANSIGNYRRDGGPLEKAFEKDGDEYELTPTGQRALEIEWEVIEEELGG